MPEQHGRGFANLANLQAAEWNTCEARPPSKAVGFVRDDVSGQAAARHALAVERHAHGLGYRYAYTVRPPLGTADPVGFVLAVAAGLEVAAIVVYDLAHVDDEPARVCESLDLETVCPPGTWARVGAPAHTVAEVAE